MNDEPQGDLAGAAPPPRPAAPPSAQPAAAPAAPSELKAFEVPLPPPPAQDAGFKLVAAVLALAVGLGLMYATNLALRAQREAETARRELRELKRALGLVPAAPEQAPFPGLMPPQPQTAPVSSTFPPDASAPVAALQPQSPSVAPGAPSGAAASGPPVASASAPQRAEPSLAMRARRPGNAAVPKIRYYGLVYELAGGRAVPGALLSFLTRSGPQVVDTDGEGHFFAEIEAPPGSRVVTVTAKAPGFQGAFNDLADPPLLALGQQERAAKLPEIVDEGLGDHVDLPVPDILNTERVVEVNLIMIPQRFQRKRR